MYVYITLDENNVCNAVFKYSFPVKGNNLIEITNENIKKVIEPEKYKLVDSQIVEYSTGDA